MSGPFWGTVSEEVTGAVHTPGVIWELSSMPCVTLEIHGTRIPTPPVIPVSHTGLCPCWLPVRAQQGLSTGSLRVQGMGVPSLVTSFVSAMKQLTSALCIRHTDQPGPSGMSMGSERRVTRTILRCHRDPDCRGQAGQDRKINSKAVHSLVKGCCVLPCKCFLTAFLAAEQV